MSQTVTSAEAFSDRWTFAAAASLVVLAAALLAGWVPILFSIVAVFLFAGPHNWMEARYFLTRMPPKWGKLWKYFTLGLGGVLLLTGSFAALPWLIERFAVGREGYLMLIASWNTAFVLWVLTLATMRSQTNPRREWGWIWPLGMLLIALAWLLPLEWDIALVYLHPFVALWFLDRELARTRPEWRTPFHAVLCLIPLLLVALWWHLAAAPHLPGSDAVSYRITQHAGSQVFPQISSHFLVAVHTFLEMIHYGVWLVAIPLVTFRSAPWEYQQIPLAKRSAWWRTAVVGILLTGLALVIVFWIGFLINYPITRDVYFTVAMLHVLAEVPFLLRLL